MMYSFETQPVSDGDPAFGIDGTFFLNKTIYVTNPDADDALIAVLGHHDYIFGKNGNDKTYTAQKAHTFDSEEIFESTFNNAVSQPLMLTINLNYVDGHKHSLSEPLIHETILSSATHRRNLEYYDRELDRLSPEAISRMSVFVRNLVDIDFKRWEEFLERSVFLHAQDFIKSMAAWASHHSDKSPRQISLTFDGSKYVLVNHTDTFYPRPGGSFGYHFEM